MNTWKITIKEKGFDRPIVTSYNGYGTKADVIAFFGLENSDVEWYKIEQIHKHINK